MRRHGRLSILLLLAASTSWSPAACLAKDGGPVVLGVTLGSATIRDLLSTIPYPESVYLSESEGEGELRFGADVLASYNREFCLGGTCTQCRVTFVMRGEPLVVEAVRIQPLTSDPGSGFSREQLVGALGDPTRKVRQPLVFDSGGLEAEVAECDSPSGEVLSDLYPEQGLRVVVESPSAGVGAQLLEFSHALLAGAREFPACERKALPPE